MIRLLAAAFVFTSFQCFALTDAELDSIGRRVWKNECAGTRDGLTSWNSGEAFASLGIGHFIWYPKGVSGPYEESFPGLVKFFAEDGGRPIPAWLRGPCPWNTKAEFDAERRYLRA